MTRTNGVAGNDGDFYDAIGLIIGVFLIVLSGILLICTHNFFWYYVIWVGVFLAMFLAPIMRPIYEKLKRKKTQ
jgi:predicted PurR-regulated permease PerM